MLRLTRRELETDPQGTAPVLDPTLGGLGAGNSPRLPGPKIVLDRFVYDGYTSDIHKEVSNAYKNSEMGK
jgi:hypothetical protein